MNRKDYEGHLRDLVYKLPTMYAGNTAAIRKAVGDTIPAERLRKIDKIILTGCGDSFLAGKAALSAFKKLTGVAGNKVIHARCIDASRYIPFPAGSAEKTLVIGVSASGGAMRLVEALTRARNRGCATLIVTNKPESNCGKAAEYRFIVGTEDSNDSPGYTSYYCSMYGLFAVAAMIGEARRFKPAGTLDALIENVGRYTESYLPELERIDAQMFAYAGKVKDSRGFEEIGDGSGYATAWFVGAKFVECAGAMAPAIDSEDWCHVHTFAHDPGNIGTIVQGQKGAPNSSRIGETVHQAFGTGRPVLFVCDGTKEDFGIKEDVEVCRVPEPPKGYDFLMPLMDHVPGSLVASYIAAMWNVAYFRRDDERRAAAYAKMVKEPTEILDF